jgi:hypothetical protein
MRGKILKTLPALALAGLSLSACAPSILHFSDGSQVAVPGEVPRDSQGNPVWSAIKPPPANWQAGRPGLPAPPVVEGSKP